MASKIRQQRSLAELTTDALCLAMSAALRLSTPLAMAPPAAATDTPAGAGATDKLPLITLDQVTWHDSESDCWIVIHDSVYDVTSFLSQHPGGREIILENAGRDASLAFQGSGHSAHAWKALEKYIIGKLPAHERLFKTKGESQPYASGLISTSG